MSNNTGPTAEHGQMLLHLVRVLGEYIDESTATGRVPVVDAVELRRCLVSMIRGDSAYEWDEEKVRHRFRRIERGHGITVHAPSFQWKPRVVRG